MDLPDGEWELVTDCETAGPLAEAVKAAGKEDEFPVRAHPYLPIGQVFAMRAETDWPGDWVALPKPQDRAAVPPGA